MTFTDIIEVIKDEVINPIWRFLFALAIVVFMVGILRVIASPDDPEAIETGKRHVLWSLVGFALILLATGFINLVASILRTSP